MEVPWTYQHAPVPASDDAGLTGQTTVHWTALKHRIQGGVQVGEEVTLKNTVVCTTMSRTSFVLFSVTGADVTNGSEVVKTNDETLQSVLVYST